VLRSDKNPKYLKFFGEHVICVKISNMFHEILSRESFIILWHQKENNYLEIQT